MKFKTLLTLTISLIILSGCKKDEESTDSIKAELNFNNQKISELDIQMNGTSVSGVEIIQGSNHVDVIGNGQELWFYFNANAGEMYKVSWQDSWFAQYTAGSIYVTGFESDQSSLYFQEERLLQMSGSPKVISVENSGVVYLKVRGYDSNISGSFAINVEQLNLSSAPTLNCDSTLNFTVSAGQVSLYKMNLIQDSVYNVSIQGSQYVGAYGDEVDVKVTAYRGGLNEYYFIDEHAKSPVHNSGQPNIQVINAIQTETVYLAVMGAYWWNPRSVSLSLNCQ